MFNIYNVWTSKYLVTFITSEDVLAISTHDGFKFLSDRTINKKVDRAET